MSSHDGFERLLKPVELAHDLPPLHRRADPAVLAIGLVGQGGDMHWDNALPVYLGLACAAVVVIVLVLAVISLTFAALMALLNRKK